jgi:hypothetical protein
VVLGHKQLDLPHTMDAAQLAFRSSTWRSMASSIQSFIRTKSYLPC